MQHGVGDRGAKSVVTGEPVAGPLNLSDDELKKNRADCDGDALRHRLIDDYHKARLPKFEDIETPLFSAANWGGMGLHPRGNFEGFLRAGSKQKWLEVHGDTHFTLFYAKYGQDLQRQFFDHFLKGIDNGWDKRPKVLLNIRHPGEKFVPRAENEWPLARTQWTKFYLHPDRELDLAPPEDAATLTYETSSDGVTFSTEPLTEEMEITGPVAAKLFVSSDTTDADLFLVLRVFDPHGKEVVFIGSNDPRVPVGLGWLRASHRKLDPKESKPYRPWHTHDEESAAQARRAGRARHRDLADLDRGAEGLSPGAVGARQGLRSRRHRRGAAARALSDEGRRPVHPHQSAGPAAGDLRRQEHAALRRQVRAVCAAADHSEVRMTVRAAIIGLGRWGRSLVNAVHGKTDAIKFAAAYTRTRASAEEFCREHNIPLLDRFEDALADPRHRRRGAGDAAQPARRAGDGRGRRRQARPCREAADARPAERGGRGRRGEARRHRAGGRLQPALPSVGGRNPQAPRRRPARPGDVDGRRSTPPRPGSSSRPTTGGRSRTRRRAARSPRSACIRSTT